MATLFDLNKKYDSVKSRDKYKYCHPYLTQAYPSHFEARRATVKSVFEIGIHKGGSLKAFRDYFPNANIYGLDISLDLWDSSNAERIKVFKGDQADPVALASVCAHGPFDIIIDDGIHKLEEQKASLKYLWKHLKSGGIYCIEDIIFPPHDISIFDYIKTEVLTVNAFAANQYREYVKRVPYIDGIKSVTFHRYMIVLEKT